MAVPGAFGDRLGLVIGSGLAGQPFGAEPRVMEFTVEGVDGHDHEVELEDHGHVVVLRRHGTGATHVPAHRLDHHANVRALVEARCNRVVAVASVGSLRTDWPVGTVVAPDDFLAFSAYPTFHAGIEGHSIPGFDAEWRTQVLATWRREVTTPVVDGGVYAETPGPRFETPAEVRMLAGHADVVGMTMASECILAREAGLAYAGLCKIDNLANGLGNGTLTMEEYAANTAATRDAWVADLSALVAGLAQPG